MKPLSITLVLFGLLAANLRGNPKSSIIEKAQPVVRRHSRSLYNQNATWLASD
jgi:hypothetical protein